MDNSLWIKRRILAVSVSALVLTLAFGAAPLLRSSPAPRSNGKLPADISDAKPAANLAGEAQLGRTLFARNCAHCHGDDARGNEGPTLYNLAISDARIAKRIKDGIKGEMPKFGSKLNDTDIAAVIAYLRTLAD